MPAMPLALAVSAPAPDAFKNFRRVTRAIFVSSLTHLFCGKCMCDHRAGQAGSDRFLRPASPIALQCSNFDASDGPRVLVLKQVAMKLDWSMAHHRPLAVRHQCAHLYTTIGVRGARPPSTR